MHDQAKIYVRSGAGGDGIVAFRREKRIPKGGPSGGDGGGGGDVLLRVNPKIHTLRKFERQTHFIAKDGSRGGANRKTGASAANLYVDVPPGTVVWAETGEPVTDLVREGDTCLIAKGGRGGKGNIRFVSANRQTPRLAEKGEPGTARWLRLELRVLADVGILGMPNAGKSTLLSVLSNARPLIADYPFTTIEPNLGVVYLDDQELVAADIPGLLEGAHRGVGLGHEFLRHLLRTRILIHLIAGNSPNPYADFALINAELALHSSELASKPQIIVINKLDLFETTAEWKRWENLFTSRGFKFLKISALKRIGVDILKHQLFAEYAKLNAAEESSEINLPVEEAVDQEPLFRIFRDASGRYIVRGQRIEKAASMTYWEYEEAVSRFQNILQALGVSDALVKSGIQAGDSVIIGKRELEWRE